MRKNEKYSLPFPLNDGLVIASNGEHFLVVWGEYRSHNVLRVSAVAPSLMLQVAHGVSEKIHKPEVVACCHQCLVQSHIHSIDVGTVLP
jgi:hypothetical protein